MDVHSISRFRATANIEPRHRCDFHVKIFVTLHRNENQHIFRAQEMSIHLRTVNIMLRHELETQKKRSTTFQKKMLFQDEIGCLHTCRNHLVFRWIRSIDRAAIATRSRCVVKTCRLQRRLRIETRSLLAHPQRIDGRDTMTQHNLSTVEPTLR